MSDVGCECYFEVYESNGDLYRACKFCGKLDPNSMMLKRISTSEPEEGNAHS